MIYHREFTISSCHFNGPEIYRAYRELRNNDDFPNELKIVRIQMLAERVLVGSHGHNFKIVVEIDDHFEPINDYVVDDVAIETIVMRWHNTNLSVHPDFKGLRATTETMTYLLSRKIMKMLWPAIKARGDIADFIGPTISITVHETDQIFASLVVDMADEPRQRLNSEEESNEESVVC